MTSVGLRAHLPFTGSDNVFPETPKSFATPVMVISPGWEAARGLGDLFRRYNEERPHSALGGRAPSEVYHGAVVAPQPPLRTEEGAHLKHASQLS